MGDMISGSLLFRGLRWPAKFRDSEVSVFERRLKITASISTLAVQIYTNIVRISSLF